MKNNYIDYLAFMELKNDYTLKDLKKNYIKLSKIYHPDKGGDIEKMKYLNCAKEYLEKRLSNDNKINEDIKSNADTERKNKEEAEKKAKEEAERKAKQEAERKAKQEAEEKAKKEAEKKAKQEAEEKARQNKSNDKKSDYKNNYEEFYKTYDIFEKTFDEYKNFFSSKERKEYLTTALNYSRQVGQDKSKIQSLKDLIEAIKKEGTKRKKCYEENSKKKNDFEQNSSEKNYEEFYKVYSIFEKTLEKYKNMFSTDERKHYLSIALDYSRKVGQDKSIIKELQKLIMNISKEGKKRKQEEKSNEKLNQEEKRKARTQYKEKQKQEENERQEKREKENNEDKEYWEKQYEKIKEESKKNIKENRTAFTNEKNIYNKLLICLNYFMIDMVIDESNYFSTLFYYIYVEENKKIIENFVGLDKLLSDVKNKIHKKNKECKFKSTQDIGFYVIDYIICCCSNVNDLNEEEKKYVKNYLKKIITKNIKKDLENTLIGIEFYNELKLSFKNTKNKYNLISDVINLEEIIEYLKKRNPNTKYVRYDSTEYSKIINKNRSIPRKDLADQYELEYQLISLLSKKYLLNDIFCMRDHLNYMLNQFNTILINEVDLTFDAFLEFYNELLIKHEKNDDIMKYYKRK